MEYMNRQGKTIFLNTDIDTLVERLRRGKQKGAVVRNLEDEQLHDFVAGHLRERMPYYLQAQEVIQ